MRLELTEWGDPAAPPVVLVHGVTAHGRVFRSLAERLASRFRVLAPDLRGHGRSAHEPPWNISTHCADLIETVEAAGVERAAWIGHSFGGRLVMHITAAEPSLVSRVVLLDPAIQLLPHVALGLAEDVRADRTFAGADEAIAARLDSGRLFNTPRTTLEGEMRDNLVELRDGRFGYRYCRSAVVAALGELATEPPQLDRLQLPTLLVLAGESYLVLDEQVHAYRGALGDRLEVESVAGGHWVMWDAPDRTGELVERFLVR